MMKTIMRLIYYTSILVLLALVAWEHFTARTWQEMADSAHQAQDRASSVARQALQRTDRCLSELYVAKEAAKKP